MTTVFNVLEQPGLTKLEGQFVIVELVASLTDEFAPAYVPADDLAVFSQEIVKTDVTGRWTIDLRPTAGADNEFSVTGLVYKITEAASGGESSYFINVPAAVFDDDDLEVPQWVGDLLTISPFALPTIGDFTAADTPLDTTQFDGNLNVTIDNVQSFADFFDDMDLTTGSSGSGGHVIVEDALTFTQRPTLRAGTGIDATDDNVELETILSVDVTELDVLSSGDIGTTVAPLVAGLVPTENLPALAINDVFTVPSEAAMLALEATAGDVAIRTDTEQAFILSVLPPSELDNWVELALGGSVVSVNGLTGAVVLEAGDIAVDESGFGGLLDGTVVDVQALADAVDAIVLPTTAAPSGAAGGQLTGTYPNPSVAASHSGSTHADVQAAAEATAAGAMSAHIADIASAHIAQAVNVDDSAFTGFLSGTTTVQTALASVDAITAQDVPLDTSTFAGTLNPSIVDVQTLAEAVDAFTLVSPIESVNGQVGIVVLDATDVGAIDVDQLGVADGVATLDGTGRLSIAQWPDLVSEVNGLTGEVLLQGADVPLAAEGFSNNLDITVTDVQLLAEAVDALTTSGSAGHTIKAAGTPLTARAGLNFGSNLTATDDSGNNETDVNLASTVVMPNASYSAPTLTGGAINNASGFHAEVNATLTADPTGIDIGSPFFIESNLTLNYAGVTNVGPVPASAYYGIRANFQLEGVHTYAQPQDGIFGAMAIGFGDFLWTKNSPSVALDRMQLRLGFVAAPLYIADGATIEIQGGDVRQKVTNAVGNIVGGMYYDSSTYITENDGEIDGITRDMAQVSYVSGPYFLGNTKFHGRVAYLAQDFNIYEPLGDQIGTVSEGNLIDGFAGGLVPNADTDGVWQVEQQVGFYAERLLNADQNRAAVFNGTLEFWDDDHDFIAAPAGDNKGPIIWQGTHTLDYASAGFPFLAFIPTLTFTHTASAFGAIAAWNAAPILQTDGVLTGSAWPLNIFAGISPTYRAVTTAITAETITGYQSDATFEKSGGAASLAVTTYTNYKAATTVNTGATIATRVGLEVADKLGSGTITSHVGVLIRTLTGTSTVGLWNLDSSILQGTVYGATTSGGNLTLKSTTHATPGQIILDAPQTEIVVTDYTATANTNAMLIDAAITLNFATATGKGFAHGPTVTFTQAGNTLQSYNAFNDNAQYKNSTGVDMGGIQSFNASPAINITANTATTSSYIGFLSNPTTSRTTSGRLTITDLYGLYSNATVGTNTTVTNRYGAYIASPTNNDILTTNYGVYIANQTTGTTNYGLYNLGTSVLNGIVYGDIVSGGDLFLDSTTHATTGTVFIGTSGAGSLVKIGKATNNQALGTQIGSSSVAFTNLTLASDANNDDVITTFTQYRTSSTNNTAQTIATIASTADSVHHVEATIRGRRTGGSGGSAGDVCSYHCAATFKTVSTTLTQVGTTTIMHTAESNANTAGTIDASGTSIRVRVTGDTNNDYTWQADVWLSTHST